MASIPVSGITDWHAHLYFDATSRDAAWALREAVATQFAGRMQLGRFHEKPVGPHPLWSCQIAFGPAEFAQIVPWLALNHGAIDIFVHPNTGDELRDHRDCAIWLGQDHALDLRAVGGS